MLELLIGCLVFSGMVMTVPRAIADAVATARASKAGKWDLIDRDRARRADRWSKAWAGVRTARHKQAGGDGDYRPGLGAYFSDVYHGWVEDALEKRRVKRAARPPFVYDLDTKPWHVRVDDAVFAWGRKAKDAWQARGNRPGDPTPVDVVPLDELMTPRGEADDDWVERFGPHTTPAPIPTQPAPDPPTGGQPEPEPQIDESDTDETNTEGDTMTETTAPTASTAGATGDAHDVESAVNQCNLLEDDLTAIDTSLDVIDEAISRAGSATELVEGFLRSKNVDDTTVGGMSVARDMLSPTHIKALMDAVAAAKEGVRSTRDGLASLEEANEMLQGADGSVLNGR